MRDKLLLFVGALILVLVAGCFYVAPRRYAVFKAQDGPILRVDHLTGRVWVVGGKNRVELGWTELRSGEESPAK